MRTPLGWARAQMHYDLATVPPPPGSLLESVFLLIAKRRQESQYFQTQAIIAATLAPHSKDTNILRDALNLYKDTSFPFLAGEKEKEEEDLQSALKHWTEEVKAIKVRPLWRAHDHRGLVSKLRRGAARVIQIEEERRKRAHRRI